MCWVRNKVKTTIIFFFFCCPTRPKTLRGCHKKSEWENAPPTVCCYWVTICTEIFKRQKPCSWPFENSTKIWKCQADRVWCLSVKTNQQCSTHVHLSISGAGDEVTNFEHLCLCRFCERVSGFLRSKITSFCALPYTLYVRPRTRWSRLTDQKSIIVISSSVWRWYLCTVTR